jgi:preprotein translocase subunit SecD
MPDNAGGYGRRVLFAAVGGLCLATASIAEPLAIEVTSANAGYDQRGGRPTLIIRLAESSRQAMHDVSIHNIARKIRLRIGEKPVLTTVIREPLGVSIQIASDDLSTERINELVEELSKPGIRVDVEVVPD